MRFHHLTLSGTLVIDPAKMQQPVGHHPVQLRDIVCRKLTITWLTQNVDFPAELVKADVEPWLEAVAADHGKIAPVGHHPVQLRDIVCRKLPCVGSHRIERYINVAAYHRPLAVIKSDYIREVVMLEKLPVHLKDAGIIGKNIRKRTRYLAVIGRHSFNAGG